MYEKEIKDGKEFVDETNKKITTYSTDKTELEKIKTELEKEIEYLENDFIIKIERYVIKDGSWAGKKADKAETAHSEIKREVNKYASNVEELKREIEEAINKIEKTIIKETVNKEKVQVMLNNLIEKSKESR